MNALIQIIFNKKKKERKKERKGFQNVHSFNCILTEVVAKVAQETKQKKKKHY